MRTGAIMSFQAMAWAAKQKLKAREKVTLLMLANYASNEQGDCYPSINTLCDDTGLAKTTLIDALKTLVNLGAINIVHNKKHGVSLPNTYQLNFSFCMKTRDCTTSANVGGVVRQANHGSTAGDSGVVRQANHGSTAGEPLYNLSVNLSNKPINESISKPITPTANATVAPQTVPMKIEKIATEAKTESANEITIHGQANQKQNTAGTDAWNAYADAYFNRYGTEAVRNAKANSLCKQLVERLGKTEAPHVAAFFVNINDAFYIKKCHGLEWLIKDCEAIRTQWATNTAMTSTKAMQQDRNAQSMDIFKDIKNNPWW